MLKNNIQILKYFVLLLITFLMSDFVFAKFRLYYEFPTLDIYMHIWGGFLMAGFLYHILFKLFKGKFDIQKSKNNIQLTDNINNLESNTNFKKDNLKSVSNNSINVNIFILLFCVFMIGIDWEIFEYVRDIINFGHWVGDILDTASDIMNDMIGAIIYIFMSNFKNYK